MAIARLDAVTIAQIAAGEIVERPLAVVKELVENALDAGASQIVVSVIDGGLTMVEVADDGSGIAPDELPFALERHATSKLRDAGGLTSITTLGFRGEGLASIAAVARTSIVSRRAGAEHGASIEAFAQTRSAVQPAAAPPGTRVTVRDLFSNVPVRREYLRSAAAEFGRISAWLATLTLNYPEVGFRLTNDGKPVFSFPPGGDIRQRLIEVFGRDAADELLPLAAPIPDLHGSVNGFISRPGCDRPTRRMQILFVNRRLLRTQALSGAWHAAYATYAMTGRYPFGVIFLELRPQDVDVNVHPTKFDVRFRFGNQVFDAVRRALAATLAANAAAITRSALSFGPAGGFTVPPATAANGATPLPFEFGEDGLSAAAASPALRVLAQLDRTYILASDGRALVLVDQHAAHERIAYERIAQSAQGGAPSEPLLAPDVVELEPAQSARLDRVLALLHAAGLEVESFGERTYRITATPAGYGGRRLDIGDVLGDLDEPSGPLAVRERIWASLACHSVVRAGDRMEFAEMNALVEQLQRCANPMHCPHGRPTFVRFEPDDLARLFKRM